MPNPKMERARIMTATLFASSAILAAGCSTNQVTGRTQVMLLPASYVDSASVKAYADSLHQAASHGLLDQNKNRVARVNHIAQAIIAQAKVVRSDSAAWNWEVNVIDDVNTVNASCMAGGKILVYTGVIEQLRLTDDELAAVIGHEVSHALAEHSREQLTMAMGMSVVTGIVSAGAGAGATGSAAITQGANLLVKLPFSRSNESDADKIGIKLSAMAGYDPGAAAGMWKKMAALSDGKTGPELLSTHPSHERRIQEITEGAQELTSVYAAARPSRLVADTLWARSKPAVVPSVTTGTAKAPAIKAVVFKQASTKIPRCKSPEQAVLVKTRKETPVSVELVLVGATSHRLVSRMTVNKNFAVDYAAYTQGAYVCYKSEFNDGDSHD